MKHTAEQFTFPFEKEFFARDRVLVTPRKGDEFKPFIGEVVLVMNNPSEGGPMLVVEEPETGGAPDKEWNIQTVCADQCRLTRE